MSSEIAIKIENLSKCYQIYDRPSERLKQFILPRLQGTLRLLQKRYYNEFWALKDVSFEIKKGETVGIIGRNGSGKSTLLQMICSTLNPTGGSIVTHGRIAALLELGAGFNPDFTGRENVCMNAAVLGLTKDQIDDRLEDIIAFAEINEFIDRPVKSYSTGMLVRLAFSVAAHIDADILIVDEAFAVGDAFFVQKCMRFIRNFQKNGGSLLLVSHDMAAINNLCSKAILLNAGQVIGIGEPKEISKQYLAMYYQNSQKIDGVENIREITGDDQSRPYAEYRDMRDELINASNLRNDIEIFEFNPDAVGFGAGDAKVCSVQMLDKDGTPLSWVVGGESVTLEIRCRVFDDLSSPIIGFDFKDRLGQVVFGDNTYISYKDNPQTAIANSELVARFEFTMPILRNGDYSISAAVANGTQDLHIQHHWLHDAMVFKVHSSRAGFGLIGIPFRKIELFCETGP